MTHNDEEFILARISKEVENAFTIANDIEIDGVTYNFTERRLSLGFSMILPKSFDMLAPEYIKLKYPYEDRPHVILSNEKTDTDFAFDYGETSNTSLAERTRQYKSVIKRIYPSNVFLQEEIYKVSEEIEVASYDYRSSAIDADIYNLNFFTDLPDKEVFGWFTCPAELQEKWEPLVRQMIQTIKVVEEE